MSDAMERFDEDGVLITDDAARHTIGGNNPPAPDRLKPDGIREHLSALEKVADLTARKERSLVLMPKWKKAYTKTVEVQHPRTGKISTVTKPVIQTEQESQRSTDFIGQMQDILDEAETLRKAEKAPYIAGGKAVDAFLKGRFEDFLAPLVVEVNEANTLYLRQKAAREQAARDEAARLAGEQARQVALAAQQEEIARQQREDDAKAAAALGQPTPDVPDDIAVGPSMKDAIAASADAERAQKAANAKPAEMSRVVGTHGAKAALKAIATVTLVDLSLVPDAYITRTLNTTAAKAAALAAYERGDKDFTIPGVNISVTLEGKVR